MLKSIIIFLYVVSCFSLKSFNSNSNYNPKRKYYPNKDSPADDLKVITLQEASMITRHWLVSIVNNNNIKKEHISIVDKINNENVNANE